MFSSSGSSSSLKHLVIVGAAEAVIVAEIDELDAAIGAFLLTKEGFLEIAAGFGGERLCRAIALRFLGVLLVALLADVVFFELALAQDFGDVHRGRAGAAFAFLHDRFLGAFI